MGWFSRKTPPPERPPVLPGPLPRDEDRLGPVPPPPPTPHAPGVAVEPFSGVLSRHLAPGASLGEPAGGIREVAALVLSGTARHTTWTIEAGDLLLGPAADLAALSNAEAVAAALLVHGSQGSPSPLRRIGRGDLAGSGFGGITGIRALVRTAGCCVVRLGPPPGARWVLVGMRSFAVFTGRITAFDGEDVKEIQAGHLATVSDPTATLYLQAGNDSALAVGFAEPSLVVTLG